MSGYFPHERLDVFALSVDLAVAAKGLADSVPRGYRSLADQLIRSGPAVALLLAEGANRLSPAQKRQRFNEALGECGEAAATAQVMARMKLVSQETATEFRTLAGRVAAMLVNLNRSVR